MRKLSQFFITLIILSLFLGCSSDLKTLKMTPKSLDFEKVYIGDSSSLDVIMKNKYGTDLLIGEVIIEGSTDFSIDPPITSSFILGKNMESSVTVKFAPLNSGQIDAVLKIKHALSAKYVEVALTGIGEPIPRISVSENSFDFQKKLINKTHTHDFEIENIGSDDLVISSLNLSGPGVAVYKVTSSPVTILPNAIETITITFEPVVVGTYEVELQIEHNAINESSPISYTIKGEGIFLDPQITLNQISPWDFGVVANIIPSIEFLEIENTGSDPLTVSSLSLMNGTEFKVDSRKDSNGNDINLPRKIAVGDKIVIGIEFAPTAATQYNDTLSIEHDGTNEATPIDISLVGTGKIVNQKTFNYTGYIEQWTIPAGINQITIEAWGSEGGDHSSSTISPGKGARMRGTVTVSPGDVIKILVGQKSTRNNGGGGTFVCTINDTPLVIAGGGGGSAGATDIQTKDGQITTSGGAGANGGVGGTNGNGGAIGTSSWNAGAGGGLLTDGASGSAAGGKAFVNGGTGGGFGGGGTGSLYHVGGGAGGYSGGGAGGNTGGAGGGGGSYNSGTNQSNSAGVNVGNGKVVITY